MPVDLVEFTSPAQRRSRCSGRAGGALRARRCSPKTAFPSLLRSGWWSPGSVGDSRVRAVDDLEEDAFRGRLVEGRYLGPRPFFASIRSSDLVGSMHPGYYLLVACADTAGLIVVSAETAESRTFGSGSFVAT